jgi:hypothetical protein
MSKDVEREPKQGTVSETKTFKIDKRYLNASTA